MSNFYGNLPNASRNQFQFDKIYPNRRAMTLNASSDEVFVGRYVLVEYDTDVTTSYRIKVYRNDSDFDNTGFLYGNSNYDESSRIKYTTSTDQNIDENRPYNITFGIYNGIVVYVQESDQSSTFYQCVGKSGDYAIFEIISGSPNYTLNYIQDKRWAEDEGLSFNKGWDSTVWQKVYAEGQSKYIMVAELNTNVPTFKVSTDAPSISPIAPHFDERSNNQYYMLHWQPQWGLRVKSARNDIYGPQVNENGENLTTTLNLRSTYTDILSYPSDVNAVWHKYDYNKTTDEISSKYFLLQNNTTTGTWIGEDTNNSSLLEEARKGFPAAIYFNKDGFSYNKIIKSEDLFTSKRLDKFSYVSSKEDWPNEAINDSIQITPSGLSGHLYNEHNGNFITSPKIDTFEMSIMLPSIGDTISNIWDLIYGGRTTNTTINNTSIRNTDISWEDANLGSQKQGLRLIKLENGTFSYKPAEVNTLAGCINTAHDIMGMIIHDTSGSGLDLTDQTDLNNLSSHLIYLNGGKFYRKRKFYDYLVPENNSDIHKYERIDFNFDPSATYYDKVASNYLVYTDIPQEDGKILYLLNMEPESLGTFSDTYKPFTYYFKVRRSDDPNNSNYNVWDYYLETSVDPNPEKTYVTLTKYDENGNIVDEYDEDGNPKYRPYGRSAYFYAPNVYYYFEDNEEEDTPVEPILEDSLERDTEKQYYIQVESYYRDKVTNEYINIYTYTPIDNNLFLTFTSGKYYNRVNDSFTLLLQKPNAGELIDLYILPYISEDVNFFQSGKYYYKSNNNWLLDNNAKYTLDREYYAAPDMEAQTDLVFYRPGIYYYGEDENHLTLDGKDSTYDANKTYWKKLEYHVVEDPNNLVPIGTIWYGDLDELPPGVKVNNVKERWGIDELESFTDKSNTMLGLLLEMKNLLDTAHTDTRDINTIQGSINTLKDIISNFGDRHTKQFMISNSYGQIAGSAWTSAQSYQYTNIGTGITSAATAAQENQWAYVNIDPTYTSPLVTFKHRLVSEMNHAVTDTATIANKNNNTAVGTGQTAGLNFGSGDTLKLYTPIIDSAGHVVGKNTETVTLPFGFKILKSLAQSEDDNTWSTAAGAESSIIADSTQDTLSLATGNKWIRVIADITNDKLTLAHETHEVTPTTSTGSLAGRISNSVSFAIPTYGFDNAGHYNSLDTKTYTLTMPYVFKTIGISSQSNAITDLTVNTANIVADTIEDTLTFATANKWIKLAGDADADTIQIAHSLSGVTSGNYGDSSAQTPDFGETFKVPYISVDVAGHIISISEHNVTIPNDVGGLTLSTYSLGSDITALAATDTVNEAFSKLQAKINSFGDIVTHNVNEFDAVNAASAVQTAVIGTNEDAASADTIYGAKAYADALSINEIPICSEDIVGTYILKCDVSLEGTEIVKDYYWDLMI